MVKRLILITIILGSLSVYNLAMIGPLTKVMEYVAIFTIFGVLIISILYDKNLVTIRRNFKWPIFFFFLAYMLSMYTSFTEYNQSLITSMHTQRGIYFYLFYFVLHSLRATKEEVIRVIIIFGIIYCVAYLLQFFAFPSVIFNVLQRSDRGTIRIYMDGSGYALLAYFFFYQRFLTTNKPQFLIFALAFLGVCLLFGARSMLLLVSIPSYLMLIFLKKVRSRLLIAGTIIGCSILFFILFQDIIAGLMADTERDKRIGGENVRIKAVKFFFSELFPTRFSYISGNGVPRDRSAIGMNYMIGAETGHYNISDVGIFGNYVQYGAFFVLAAIILIFQSMLIKVKEEMIYIKYFMFFLVFLMLPIAIGLALPGPIATICCMLYLMDISNAERKADNYLREDPTLEKDIGDVLSKYFSKRINT